jgi:hypothetical protein
MLFPKQSIFMSSAVNDWRLTRRLWFCLEDLPELPTALLASSHVTVYVARKATLVTEVRNQKSTFSPSIMSEHLVLLRVMEDANSCHHPYWLYSGKHLSCCLIGCFSRRASFSAFRRPHFFADAGIRTISNQWFLRHV